MKFTDSPVIELPVRNPLISLQQDNRSMHVGTFVWPCSLVLVKFIDPWSRTRTKPDSDYLLGLSTKYLSLRNLPKCRHCAIQARESDPNQSSTANKVLAIVTAENPFRNRYLDYYSILQIRRSESRIAGSFEPNRRGGILDILPELLLHVRVREGVRGLLLEVPEFSKKVSWGSGEVVNLPLKTEKNGEIETEYSVCCIYFPLEFEKEREKVGVSGNRVNLGGNVCDFVWIPDEKKDGKNDCVKGNVGIGMNVKTKAGRWMNVIIVGRKTKKVLGNNIGRNEGMDDESGDDESVELEFYKGNDDDVYVGLIA
ncbi:hypothetical protein SO802_015805 [Lithocarpus litseifolius]|uniref:Uncharacterized protein n=1 Tax=Lithocarpus litseifolius TaxID=425828 RepID=A0AAW2CVB9_9ROSI